MPAVQTAIGYYEGSGTSSVTATFASTVTAGNVIIVIVRTGFGGSITSVSLTLDGITAGTVTQRANDSTQDPQMFLFDSGTVLSASGVCDVQVNLSVAEPYVWVFAIEASGITGFDVAAAHTGSGNGNSVFFTTTNANDYLVLGSSQNNFATYTGGPDSLGNTWNLLEGHIGASGFGGVQDFTSSSLYSTGYGIIVSSITNQYTAVMGAYKVSGGTGPAVNTRPYQSPFGWS